MLARRAFAIVRHFFNSITDAVVLTMKTSFTARLLITALSVAALSSAARADDLNIKTMIPGAPQIDAESWILIDYNLARYWLKTMPTPAATRPV
ncbi:D-alanyl-D-alanine carboxypeptidase [Klebsiella pneumoniae]|uniref:D-alanyl-D-alanine carboxypeptidase n=1 Tax=Klebsiella pneumoniae TaxID=573 RepID=A0A377W5F0_KLEPN|nr:D-alanyl-D-alanine carboxypeptidase [Klebsiella pneumoniae]